MSHSWKFAILNQQHFSPMSWQNFSLALNLPCNQPCSPIYSHYFNFYFSGRRCLLQGTFYIRIGWKENVASAHLKVTLKVLISLFILLLYLPVILLKIAMVSPVTHLVRNHESQSRTSESQLKKTSPKLKMLGPFVTRQLIWRQTPKLCITVYWN